MLKAAGELSALGRLEEERIYPRVGGRNLPSAAGAQEFKPHLASTAGAQGGGGQVLDGSQLPVSAPASCTTSPSPSPFLSDAGGSQEQRENQPSGKHFAQSPPSLLRFLI